MTSPPLSCTVRDCGLLLERRGRTLQCARSHSYDLSRAGYLNLLQPQDRKSLTAGDRGEAVQARARLLAANIGDRIAEEFVARAAQLIGPGSTVVDLGAGAGDVLGRLATRTSIDGVGIDLSTEAAEMAARRFPELTWVVANADRRLPLLDGTVDLVLSLHGRRNAAECARVLGRDGHLLVGVPAPDDLIELRELVQGQPVVRDRTDAVIAEHDPLFRLSDRVTVREQHQLEPEQLRDLLRGTYRGERRSMSARLAAVRSLPVTLSSDVLLLKRVGFGRT